MKCQGFWGFLAVGLIALALTRCIAPERVDLSGETLRVGTFNLHYLSERVPEMAWEPRKRAVKEVLEAGDADLVTFQETETHVHGHLNNENIQLDYLMTEFPRYEFVAVGEPESFPSTQPMMYRPDRLTVQEQGFFFFSDTPDTIYSRSWDGGFPAFCSWVRFIDERVGVALLVFNVHFDSRSAGNRIKAAELVVERIESMAQPNDAVIVLGDFNGPWFFAALQTLADADLSIAPPQGSTFHFNVGLDLLPAIDHVLAGRGLTPSSAEVAREKFDDTWPSDHYPVFVDLYWHE